MKNKLWILEVAKHSKEWGWDCVYGIVVVAKSEKAARAIAAKKCGGEGPDVWENEAKTSCELLTADYDTDDGVVIKDFAAG